MSAAEKRVIPGAGPDQFKFASFMSVTLSCDHRVIDGRHHMLFKTTLQLQMFNFYLLHIINVYCCCLGAIGAEYLKAFKGYVENPHSMLL